jgi:hypothetical protein
VHYFTHETLLVEYCFDTASAEQLALADDFYRQRLELGQFLHQPDHPELTFSDDLFENKVRL